LLLGFQTMKCRIEHVRTQTSALYRHIIDYASCRDLIETNKF
jgi:hypothetical protein